MIENAEGGFKRKKVPLDFDPFQIWEELVPFVNKQIRNLNAELKLKNLPQMPDEYFDRFNRR